MPVSRISLPCSTSAEISNKKTIETKGIVFGEAIVGTNVIRGMAASFTSFVGGRSGAYESKLQDGRQIALIEMMEEAEKYGANAVIGVKVDYETVFNSMLMICASGTAVIIED